MNITKEVREILNLPAGRDLDRRVAEALEWKCLAECPQPCRHIPLYSTQPGAAFFLRIAMSKLGWTSEDNITWMGWGDEDDYPWGYSVWFKRWVKHIQYVLVSTVHDPEQASLAIAQCALLALTEPEAGMYASSKEVEEARKARMAKHA
jgi:hypothetical protein